MNRDSNQPASRLEHFHRLAAAYPRLYRWRVLLTSYAANALVALSAVLALAWVLAGWFLMFKMMFAGVVILFAAWPVLMAVLGSMRRRDDFEPEGLALHRQAFPDLFDEIDRLRGSLNTPRLHRVLLTDDFNAGVYQQPRLGGWCGYRNHLMIGLPLMAVMNRDQFVSVLAHELAHISHGHGRFSQRIYRHRTRWLDTMNDLENREHRFSLLGALLRRFIPYFDDLSFPLAQQSEYEADATAAKVVPAEVIGQSSCNLLIVNKIWLDAFWRRVWREADDSPRPEVPPYRRMFAELAGLPENHAGELDGWLRQVLGERARADETHPSLRESLNALGVRPAVVWPTPSDHAFGLLNGQAGALTEALDDEWWLRASENWQQWHQEALEGREQLQMLNQAAVSGSLKTAEAYRRACLTERYGSGLAEATRLMGELCATHPGARHHFEYGRMLLDADDGDGVRHLHEAVAQDEFLTVPAATIEARYHRRNGRDAAADYYEQTAARRHYEEECAKLERDAVYADDTFLPAELSDELLHSYTNSLKNLKQLKKLYIVEKKLHYLSHRRLWVVAYQVRRSFTEARTAAAVEHVRRALFGRYLPQECLLVPLNGCPAALAHRIRKVSGSLKYHR